MASSFLNIEAFDLLIFFFVMASSFLNIEAFDLGEAIEATTKTVLFMKLWNIKKIYSLLQIISISW